MNLKNTTAIPRYPHPKPGPAAIGKTVLTRPWWMDGAPARSLPAIIAEYQVADESARDTYNLGVVFEDGTGLRFMNEALPEGVSMINDAKRMLRSAGYVMAPGSVALSAPGYLILLVSRMSDFAKIRVSLSGYPRKIAPLVPKMVRVMRRHGLYADWSQTKDGGRRSKLVWGLPKPGCTPSYAQIKADMAKILRGHEDNSLIVVTPCSELEGEPMPHSDELLPKLRGDQCPDAID